MMKSTYNNTIRSSTSKAPAEVVYGKPLLLVLPNKDEVSAVDQFIKGHDTFIHIKFELDSYSEDGIYICKKNSELFDGMVKGE